MNRHLILMPVVALALACSASRARTDINPTAFSDAMAKYYMSIEVGKTGTPEYRFIYSDRSGHVHVYKIDDGTLVQDWEVTSLGSHATAMFVTDLYGDAKQKLVLGTARGRVLIYDLASYELEWENLQTRYVKIEHMANANLDGDRQEELVILADDKLFIYDSYNRNLQWNSTTNMIAKFCAIGNVDDDPQLEIVLSSGIIVDARFYNIQFQTDQPFGDRLSMADVTGDGFPEVIGEFVDRTIRVFDVWRGREVW